MVQEEEEKEKEEQEQEQEEEEKEEQEQEEEEGWKRRGAASSPTSLSHCQRQAQLVWPRNGQRKKILETRDKKGLFALKKRVHRISCSPFYRQSYPTPILLEEGKKHIPFLAQLARPTT